MSLQGKRIAILIAPRGTGVDREVKGLVTTFRSPGGWSRGTWCALGLGADEGAPGASTYGKLPPRSDVAGAAHDRSG